MTLCFYCKLFVIVKNSVLLRFIELSCLHVLARYLWRHRTVTMRKQNADYTAIENHVVFANEHDKSHQKFQVFIRIIANYIISFVDNSFFVFAHNANNFY